MRERPGQPGPESRSAPASDRPASAAAAIADGPEAMPPGTPAWITPALIALTKKVWNPRYKAQLSTLDAVTILLNTGRLIGALAQE